ncbi:hypothetical protein KFE94_18020 [bacterium SCSIO 12643]|nr:hypothetical protein KFE94_18020 [bacterium SCSIO 12643]
MKKITLLFALALISYVGVNAQAKKQLNLGLIGASYEIPVSSAITVAPTAFTTFELNYFTLGVKSNYYFDELVGLSSPWDFYAGLNLGFGIAMNSDYSSDLDLGAQIGGRWFWNEKWGVYLELGGGKLAGSSGEGGLLGGAGVTLVL